MLFKNRKLATIYLLFCFVLISCTHPQEESAFQLQQGDLLFQNTGTDEIDNAIKEVTATSAAKNYTHVGMAMQENGKWFVLEAIPKEGVCKTPLEKFLNRSKNKFDQPQTAVARLDSNYHPYISRAIAYGMERINKPYDDIFLWNNDSYYCSELVYKMFSSQELAENPLPFLTHPMTFNDSTGTPLPSWVAYYQKRNQPIPEGITGTNPNLMASSQFIEFVHDYEKE